MTMERLLLWMPAAAAGGRGAEQKGRGDDCIRLTAEVRGQFICLFPQVVEEEQTMAGNMN